MLCPHTCPDPFLIFWDQEKMKTVLWVYHSCCFLIISTCSWFPTWNQFVSTRINEESLTTVRVDRRQRHPHVGHYLLFKEKKWKQRLVKFSKVKSLNLDLLSQNDNIKVIYEIKGQNCDDLWDVNIWSSTLYLRLLTFYQIRFHLAPLFLSWLSILLYFGNGLP